MLKHEIAGNHLRGLLAELRPGDKLPTEQELCTLLQISRTTAIRALRDLESAGLVQRRQGRGSFVAEPSRPRPATIRVCGRPAAVERPYLEDALDALARSHPDIRIEFVGWAEAQVADVVRVIGSMAAEQSGDLAEIRAEQKAQINWHDLDPLATDTFSPGGRCVAAPRHLSPVVLYYNADLFHAADHPLPDATWTLDDLERATTAMTDPAHDVYGLGFAGEFPTVLPFVWSVGGEVLSPDGRRPTWSDPATVEGLNRVRRLHAASPAAREMPGIEDQIQAFRDGRVAMMLWGGVLAAELEAASPFRWGVAPVPRGRRHVTLLFSEGYGIRRTSPASEAAWAVVHALTSPASQSRLLELGVRLPANRTAQRLDPVTDLFRRELPCARLAREAGLPEVRYLVEGELEALLDGDESVEQVCRRIDHGVRMILRGRERNRRGSSDAMGQAG